ncbi:hypothetical protein [Microbulbifer rhizosphaerae]|uniref:Na+-driven multidrug efflux pump n=1 Tax=Microbulbifer rhizosphaerae TaxID=1562603 RepID=A0A7W4WA63_9GAMM|nr:hypothetical protein [Microbulbifer rhizosphaerae]MBB3060485.1 Na+-driven multidrug efflux pump [Microbulbifer rhizosphaerae]
MLSIKKSYIGLFLACYTWISQRNPSDEYNKVNAVYLMSFLMSLNLACFPALASLLFEIDVIHIYSNWTAPAIVIALSSMLLNFICIYFLCGDDIQKYMESNAIGMGNEKRMFVGYVISSVLLPTVLALYFLL